MKNSLSTHLLTVVSLVGWPMSISAGEVLSECSDTVSAYAACNLHLTEQHGRDGAVCQTRQIHGWICGRRALFEIASMTNGFTGAVEMHRFTRPLTGGTCFEAEHPATCGPPPHDTVIIDGSLAPSASPMPMMPVYLVVGVPEGGGFCLPDEAEDSVMTFTTVAGCAKIKSRLVRAACAIAVGLSGSWILPGCGEED